MTPWTVRRLGDIADEGKGEIRTGPFGSQLHRHDYTDSADGVPVVMPVNMVGGRVNSDGIAKVSPAKASDMAAHVTRVGDVLLSRRGDIGRYCLIDAATGGALCGTGSLRVSIQGSGLMPEYFCLFLETSAGLHELQKKAVGSTMPNINSSIVRSLELPIPPLTTQRKIAGIISAYDELIENNNRRIKLLEEMARRIYEEWFVDFRYPGHENVPLVESELGPIPQGWSTARVGDHAGVIRGRSYRGADVVDEGGVPFFSLKCVARDGGFRPDGVKRYAGEFKDVHRVQTGDIVMAVTDMTQERRIVARAARVPDVGEEFGVFSMDLVKIVPKDVPAEYLLGLLRYSDFPDQVKAHANGANVLHLHPDRVSDYRSPFPVAAMACHYSDQVGPSQRLSDGLHAANERLRAARDLLLPRLISGAIDMTNLNIAVREAVA